MFKSTIRDIVTPQAEHGRLTGMLAYYWGNDDFDRPPDFNSFVLGVTLHDRGYGELDNDPIDGVTIERWLEIQQRGLDTPCPDPIADIIACRHIKRLLSYDDTPERRALMAVADERIESRLHETNLSLADIDWMDRVTNLLDSITFDFGFEKPTQSTRQISPRYGAEDTIPVTYTIESGGVITVDPWSFRVELIEGYVLGYEASGYPERLAPVLIEFTVKRK